MTTIGLIQARMSSLRLPGKVMLPLAGRPLVWHIRERLRRIPEISRIVLATTGAESDDRLAEWGASEGLLVVRHPVANDIAGRLAMAVQAAGADVVVKINADCPLVDPAVVQATLDRFHSDPAADGASNKLKRTYPLGLSVEILRSHVIVWCDRNLTGAEDRELMVKWVFDHSKQFRIASLESHEDDSRFNLTVDTPDDYKLMSEIFETLFGRDPVFGWREVRAYLTTRESIPVCAFLAATVS
jgi:spore coat polysaccharide biosynthesis protein SpsF